MMRQHREQRQTGGCRWQVAGCGEGRVGREGAGRATAGKAQSQENESLMTRMQEGTILSTQAQEGGDGGAGRGWRKFQHSSRQ